jgi:hypothetical protein
MAKKERLFGILVFPVKNPVLPYKINDDQYPFEFRIMNSGELPSELFVFKSILLRTPIKANI